MLKLTVQDCRKWSLHNQQDRSQLITRNHKEQKCLNAIIMQKTLTRSISLLVTSKPNKSVLHFLPFFPFY